MTQGPHQTTTLMTTVQGKILTCDFLILLEKAWTDTILLTTQVPIPQPCSVWLLLPRRLHTDFLGVKIFILKRTVGERYLPDGLATQDRAVFPSGVTSCRDGASPWTAQVHGRGRSTDSTDPWMV